MVLRSRADVQTSGPTPPEPQRLPTLLHLFSGPTLRPDGVRAKLADIGWDCSDHDIVMAKELGEPTAVHDLSCDAVWEQIHSDMRKGEYEAVLMGTPCETASRARTGPPGPRPLRSPEHIYGLPRDQLTPEEFEQVRLGTYFALKTAETAVLATELRIPWAIENPDPSDNPVSLFHLPEWVDLARSPHVRTWDFHQCPMGAETAKPTRMLSWGIDLSNLLGSCTHAKRMWHYTDHAGKKVQKFAAHPPLAGRRREDGTMATKAAAAYPADMNFRLAAAVSKARCPDKAPPQAPAGTRPS